MNLKHYLAAIFSAAILSISFLSCDPKEDDPTPNPTITNDVVKEVYGVDSDMGHNYSWKSLRLFVKDYGVFGEVLVDSQKMLNGYKIMYLKKEV